MRRIEGLDYLRGAMALAVMIYHYVSWSSGYVDSSYLLGKLGIYAVSMFYILSGLSLGLVYYGRVNNANDIGSFLIKRVFRILPLFWLVLSASFAMDYMSSLFGGKEFDPDLVKVFLNYSLLFGFVDPSAYFNVGAWSIGNEMVFYAILPLVFLLSCRSALVLPVVVIASVAVGFYFAAYRLDSGSTLAEQWAVYVNPFNQIFLFMGGVALGVYGKNFNIKSLAASLLLVLSFLVFYLYPVSGDTIAIVTGAERFVLSFCCMAFVAGVYFLNPTFKAFPARILGFFGSACYSIYLLHPLVAKVVVTISTKIGFGSIVGYTASVFVTLAVSWIVFRYLEKPMMNTGKKVALAFERKAQAVVSN